MPATDDVAKAWELGLAERFGRAVRERRAALGLSAQQVSDRTREYGYPITRVAISKIEGNSRSGKIDVAELFTLALALRIPPALLLFPEFPDGDVQIVPTESVSNTAALRWLSGRKESELAAGNEGTALVEAWEKREQIERTYYEQRMLSQIDAAPDDESEEQRKVIEGVLQLREAGSVVYTRMMKRAQNSLWGRNDA